MRWDASIQTDVIRGLDPRIHHSSKLELDAFVKARVSTGRYKSADEVVHEALRLMERHEQAEAAKLKWLQDAYQEGIASGDAGELDFAALKAGVDRRLRSFSKQL